MQLYPNRAIGDERPLIDGMRLGTVDMGVITNAVIAQVEPAFQVNDMPFLFGSEAQAHRRCWTARSAPSSGSGWKARAWCRSATWRAASAT